MPALVWQSDTLKLFALPGPVMCCCSMPDNIRQQGGDASHKLYTSFKYPTPEPLRARARRLVRQDTEAAQDLAAREAAAEEERQRVRARLTRAVRCGTPDASQWLVACGGSSSVTAL